MRGIFFLLCNLCLLLLFNPTTWGLKVLVIGATGRVGSRVVSSLLKTGVQVNALVRQPKYAQDNPLLQGATFFNGDVNSKEDLLHAAKDCQAIVAVHGPKPIRFTKIMDLFRHPSYDPSHPYQLYYKGSERIIQVMQELGISKYIRLTGSMTDRSFFHPFVLFFNLFLSGAVIWHKASEKVIRQSGLDYTIVRVPEILNEPALEKKEKRKRNISY